MRIRAIGVLRELPGQAPSLSRLFTIGVTRVLGASFVYASALVGRATLRSQWSAPSAARAP